MTYMTDEEIAFRVAQLLGIANRPHLEAVYKEDWLSDGSDEWEGYLCPRCGCDDYRYDKTGCYRHYPSDPRETLSLITFAEKLDVGFSLYNTKHYETGKIEYEAIFYDPWGGPQCTQYKVTDENRLRAIDLAFIKMMESR